MRGLWMIGLGLLVSSSGCTDDEAHAKLGKMEERLARMEATLTRIDAVTAKVARIDREIDRLSDIEARIEKLESEVRKPNRAAAARPPRQRPRRPDPAAVYAVPVAGSAYDGRRAAKVTLVKAFEFACPFCKRVSPTIEQLKKEYGRDLKVVYKHYIVHPSTATIPAQAACAANLQGKFMRMYDLIWRKGFDASRNLSRDNMMKLARQARLKMSKFRADMDKVCPALVRREQAELARVGARGTPAFFINGRFLSGARPINQFKTLIDEELAKANERIRNGTSLRKYYSTWVLEKGRQDL